VNNYHTTPRSIPEERRSQGAMRLVWNVARVTEFRTENLNLIKKLKYNILNTEAIMGLQY
jgi:hypothetical protein